MFGGGLTPEGGVKRSTYLIELYNMLVNVRAQRKELKILDCLVGQQFIQKDFVRTLSSTPTWPLRTGRMQALWLRLYLLSGFPFPLFLPRNHALRKQPSTLTPPRSLSKDPAKLTNLLPPLLQAEINPWHCWGQCKNNVKKVDGLIGAKLIVHSALFRQAGLWYYIVVV